MKNRTELAREITQSVALLYELARRVAIPEKPETAYSCYHFSSVYDGYSQEATQTNTTKKWHPFFRGDRPLTKRALDMLESVPMWADARQVYHSGPAGLWRALWGDMCDQVACVRTHPNCTPKTSLHEACRLVEMSVLCAGKGEISLVDLVRSVALYRLRLEIEPAARIDGIGLNMAGCAWSLIQSCLDESAVLGELDALRVKEPIHRELAALETTRAATTPRLAL
ncbi:hypothetical protein KUG47_09575 [Falsochrobactrum sp. TDYN1]|uniref:Uncharacterized protein n=1 Tax=Falsochrobactrum tianjinense TaxID=2706015 RepID=A0A949PN71_9HYPH|nr:hypothetical protein [Falsochrobactrum sp. TDYN1]MBV2143747.1 hypothetical protein [Falsochrobactrum sp. TDYN1]